jgi:hypothetical protein
MSHRTRSTVTAAFAHEGSAAYARRLIGGAVDISVTYNLRNIFNERGTVEMVVLEATLADPLQAGRVETLLTGANGMLIPAEVATVALRAG